MANDFLPFSTSGTANVYTNAEYAADTDQANGNQPGIAKSKLVNKALRQCSIISTVVAQFISDITGANSVDDGTTATLLANLKLATKGRIGANIASATTTTVGADSSGDVMHITGTTTITSLGIATTGIKKALIFDGILTLTHNATSLILPGAANITTSAGSVGTFICIDGALGYWKCIGYTDDITNKAVLKTYFDTIYAPLSGKPAISVYLNSQQNVTSATWTKISFAAETYDTTNAFDPVTNFRFTPLVAGKYHVDACATLNGVGSTRAGIRIYKNGALHKHGNVLDTPSTSNDQVRTASADIEMNGTTDYIEVYAFINGTSTVVGAGLESTYLNAHLIIGA